MELLDGGAGNDVIYSGGSYWRHRIGANFDFALTTDRLFGGGGDDRLIGGKGFVEMTGGAGADIFEARCDIFEVPTTMRGHDRHSRRRGRRSPTSTRARRIGSS